MWRVGPPMGRRLVGCDTFTMDTNYICQGVCDSVRLPSHPHRSSLTPSPVRPFTLLLICCGDSCLFIEWTIGLSQLMQIHYSFMKKEEDKF